MAARTSADIGVESAGEIFQIQIAFCEILRANVGQGSTRKKEAAVHMTFETIDNLEKLFTCPLQPRQTSMPPAQQCTSAQESSPR